MVYTQLVKTQRWILINDTDKSYSRMRLGKTCQGGCIVPKLTKKEEKDINEWFFKKGITKSNNISNIKSWDVRSFSYWYRPSSSKFSERLWFHGGYEFRVSCDSYSLIKTKK